MTKYTEWNDDVSGCVFLESDTVSLFHFNTI